MSDHPRSPYLFELMSAGKRSQYAKGESLAPEDIESSLLMVEQGHVSRYSINNDGSLGIQIVYVAGDIFSLTKVYMLLQGFPLYSGRESYYYRSLSDTVVRNISLQKLKEVAEKRPELYAELFYEAGVHLRTCVHRIENVAMKNSYRRVAHEIFYMAREYGIPAEDGGTRIVLPLTQQEIAGILGITRPTVTLALSELRRKGILKEGRELVAVDIGRLGDEAYG